MEIVLSNRVAMSLLVRLMRRHTTVVQAAHNNEAPIRSLFYEAVSNAQKKIKITQLVEALQLPGTGGAIYLLDNVFTTFADTLMDDVQLTHAHQPFRRAKTKKVKLPQILHKTLNAGARSANIFELRFDLINPIAVEWAEAHAAELVTNLVAEQKAAVRSVIVEGLAEGVPPQTSAKIIRNIVGLSERDALAVMRRHVKLLSEGVKSNEALNRTNLYANKLLRARGKTISVHETMTASNEGQRQLWKQAQEEGYLTGTERKTIIQADPCPICTKVSGEVVGINEEFSIGLPPFHVRCRCTEGIVK